MPTKAAYLGPVASFSHQAAKEYSQPDIHLVPKPSFAEVFSAVQSSEVDYGVIPFENSSNGSVVQTLDLLADRENTYSDIQVCDEHYLTVHHCLLVKACKQPSSSDIADRLQRVKKVYTHPQAWGQCDRYLSTRLKGIERQDVSSTSKAAQVVAEEDTETSAAIASKLVAETHGLSVLTENIEDSGDNTTRFFIIVKSPIKRFPNPDEDGVSLSSRRWKSLITFTIDHGTPGALAEGLIVFKRHGLNLTSIDTRPSRRMPWHYIFFVECRKQNSAEQHRDSVDLAMRDLRGLTQDCRHLGTWGEHASTHTDELRQIAQDQGQQLP